MKAKIRLARKTRLAQHYDLVARYRHIIWDWNGTLLDDVQACADAINVLLSRRSMPAITLEQYLNVFAFPVRNYYLKLGFDFTRDRWDDVAVEYHEAYARTSAASPLRPGTPAALDLLKARGIGISVLSACEFQLLKRMMAQRGVLEQFEHVYGLSDLFAHSKLDLGHALLQQGGLSREDTLLVGDTTHDHEVAQALGISCLLMSGGHQAESKLAGLGCPVCPDYKRVIDYILE